MIFEPRLPPPCPDESEAIGGVLKTLDWPEALSRRVSERAVNLIVRVRERKERTGDLDRLLRQYPLDTEEGRHLLELAEALLRVPDSATVDALIAEKTGGGNWLGEALRSSDWTERAASLGLALARGTIGGMFSGIGKPIVRTAMRQVMQTLSGQFVLGRTMDEALKNGRKAEEKGYLYSYDMLGEAARTAQDADRYLEAYKNALETLCRTPAQKGKQPSLSVKLSALHPRYAATHAERCIPEIADRLLLLAKIAAAGNVALTVDAEESHRLEPSLKIFESVSANRDLRHWTGLGLAVQAYQKRALAVIDWARDTARAHDRTIQVRLVKGAYWDSEIKRAQVLGLADYPVYTKKANTDAAFLACAQKLLEAGECLYPMFATHNAHTLAAILEMAGKSQTAFEFQKLHGMGTALYDALLEDLPVPVRIYAPVGTYQDLLPYLVRRLLENGANASFVHKIRDPNLSPETLASDPIPKAGGRHSEIPVPPDLYGPDRRNSQGLDPEDSHETAPVLAKIAIASETPVEAMSLIDGKPRKAGIAVRLSRPHDTSSCIGTVWNADGDLVEEALQSARKGFSDWSATDAKTRAAILEKAADLMEAERETLVSLCVREGGRTVSNALDELREAVDFCRYYARQGRTLFQTGGSVLPGPTGERNSLSLHGRGIFVCISPWNFPLAIFTGQIVAALMSGNAVLAKPAEQTPLCAFALVRILHRAGIPSNALHLLTGDGRIGALLTGHSQTDGVAFTGSTDTARSINAGLAARSGPIVPLIAETGGQNVLIADSTALPEQLVDDVLRSAFDSAGQRCSALRVLFVQNEIADKVLAMLSGAIQELKIGDPADLSTDVGPVIDAQALNALKKHVRALEGFGKFVARTPLAKDLEAKGHFFAPCIWEIDSISALKEEHFGPILHVIRYRAEELDYVCESVNACGYGLTLGIHSRLSSFAEKVTAKIRAGNVYRNRNMVGAVVGVQPFGGTGLSGTGPKAGGPHYLQRFATERSLSVNTAACGGDAALATLGSGA